MATYTIGDIQGCYSELLALLERIEFDPERDLLWFTGDLVNRGPHSLEVLRWVKALGERAVVVLGNHDLHLLAVACGEIPQNPEEARGERKGEDASLRSEDTFDQVLAAPDREELLEWLRHRPLLHHDPVSGFTLIHAGLPPQWDLAKARECAAEVEAVLKAGDYAGFLRNMYNDMPDYWSDSLEGWDRLRFITNCLTRLRYCTQEGRIVLGEKGPPGSQPIGFMPWYEVPGRASRNLRIIFGHWSTLRLSPEFMHKYQVYPLDTGCFWGGELTALRLEDLRLFRVAAINRAQRDTNSGPKNPSRGR